MEINRTNYESFFLLYLDRELNANDRRVVEDFLHEHADLQKEFNLLQKTIQWPTDLVFESKETLYRSEKKRKIIPRIGLRVAAALVLILTGGWYLRTVINNHNQQVAGREQKALALAKHAGLLPIIQSGNPQKENKPSETLVQASRVAEKQLSKNIPSDVSGLRAKTIQQKAAPDLGMHSELLSPENQDEALIVTKHSTEVVELQNGTNPSAALVTEPVLVKAATPALLLSVSQDKDLLPGRSLHPQNPSMESAISVIALDEHNKTIAGFFKKLTRHIPADETADNNKKLRVSVFQISY